MNIGTTKLKLIHSRYNYEGLIQSWIMQKTAAGVKLVKRFINQKQFWLARFSLNCHKVSIKEFELITFLNKSYFDATFPQAWNIRTQDLHEHFSGDGGRQGRREGRCEIIAHDLSGQKTLFCFQAFFVSHVKQWHFWLIGYSILPNINQ